MRLVSLDPTDQDERAAQASRRGREGRVATACVAAGLLVAAALSPWHQGLRTFAWNAAYWWVPEGAVLGLLLVLRARPAIVGGAALGWSAYLVPLWFWIESQPPRTLPALVYAFAVPGGCTGAVVAWLAGRRGGRSGLRAGVAAGICVAAGLAASRWVISRAGSARGW